MNDLSDWSKGSIVTSLLEGAHCLLPVKDNLEQDCTISRAMPSVAKTTSAQIVNRFYSRLFVCFFPSFIITRGTS